MRGGRPRGAARPAACPAGIATARQRSAGATRGSSRDADLVLLCRYGGLNDGGAAFRLWRPHARHRRATVPASRASSTAPADDRRLHCPPTPAPRSSRTSATGGPDDPVTVGLDGCLIVANGHVHRTAGVQATGRRLVAALAALVPQRRCDARLRRRRGRRAGPRRRAAPSAPSRAAARGSGRCTTRRRDLLGRAGRDDAAALVAALRAEVDEPVGALDHVEVVLDHDDRVAGVDEPVRAPRAAA